MPAIPRTTTKILIGLALLALGLTSVALEGQRTPPAQAHHLCGNTGSPYGPFDLQTYEDRDYKTTYARTMELAGWNQLLPDRPTFALPPLEGVQSYPYVPPVLLKAIAWIESGWAQASYDPPVQYGQVGPVLSSHDCGYGIMQVTSGMQNVSGVPNLDQAMIGGHYGFNIARGARILAEKWNGAPEFRPVVGARNSQILEDWYYALWSYNGFASKNHPLSHNPNRSPYLCNGTQPRGDYPYQELVLGCVAHPPVRGGVQLWPAQEVTLPNLSDPAFAGLANWDAYNACVQTAQCASMNIPTPNSWHVDPARPTGPREEVIGSPVLNLSAGHISLAAVPGGESLPFAETVSNAGTGVLSWRATSTASWLRTSRYQGVSLGGDLGGQVHNLQVYADASGLPPGTYSGVIAIESPYSWGAPAPISVTLLVDLQAGQIETGDFTGDGRTDVAYLCCSDFASLWLSNNAGAFDVRTFRPSQGYSTGVGSWESADLNGDGREDLIHLCCEDYVHTWLSNGDGTFNVSAFRPWAGYAVQRGVWRVGDFSGDARVDLVHVTGLGYVHQWTSTGSGGFDVRTFQPWPGYNTGIGSWHSGDFTGDGKEDLVHITNADYIHTWWSHGDGSFAVGSFQPWPGYGISAGSWRTGDFNGDGNDDLVHLTPWDYVHDWLSQGDGSFAVGAFRPWPGYGISTGSWQSGDFNADGKTDLIHLTPYDYVHPWLSNGDGSFGVGAFRPWPGYSVGSGEWHGGDFNADARTDLLHLCCRQMNVWRSQGNGTFAVGALKP